MFYIWCCMLGFIHYQLIINLLQFSSPSIKALPFPKKIVFRVGKKSVANRQALLQFWVANTIYAVASPLIDNLKPVTLDRSSASPSCFCPLFLLFFRKECPCHNSSRFISGSHWFGSDLFRFRFF